ncbi:type II toxin-antitoxin system RelE/ParE family toxin [Leptospira bandrabouensis]|uniref:type II toxin-antitoxin system RelE/ParE family toxin n=1 Tax=Leptospira bandrabouensis TaxID=2484903 RepID=UPI001EEAB70D|nr:type II toxin-antitoxin system RelE/ParE family toxin [Leptospira bandrabouensis]
MARKWKVYYYSESENEESEIETSINSKDERNQAKILAWIDKLEELGPNLPRPYADILKDVIHELRIKLSGDQVRILYFFCYKDYVILTNYFIKRSDKVPKTEMDKAMKRREKFLKKYPEKEIGKLLS